MDSRSDGGSGFPLYIGPEKPFRELAFDARIELDGDSWAWAKLRSGIILGYIFTAYAR